MDPGFQVRGGAFKKNNIFGVICVKNHDFMQKKILFFPILGGARTGCTPPPLDPPLYYNISIQMKSDDSGISTWDNILYSIQVTIVTSFQLNIVPHK